MSSWTKRLLLLAALCTLAFAARRSAYEWLFCEIQTDDRYPEGTQRVRAHTDRWTGERVFRQWFRSGVLRIESISDSSGDRYTTREWYDIPPGRVDAPRLRLEETANRNLHFLRRVMWNYDGSVDPELSVTSYQGDVAARTTRVHVQKRASLPTSGMGSISWLETSLDNHDPAKREQAARTLGYLQRGDVADSIAALLTDPDPFVALAAAESLGEMGPAADDAVDLLVAYTLGFSADSLQTWETCDISTSALESIGTARALDGLVRIIGSWRCRCQSDAIRRVASFEHGELAIDALLRACKDRFLFVDAVVAIGAIGHNAGRAAPELTSMLEELKRGDFRRRYVIESLGEIGPSAKIALPALMAVAKEERSLDDTAQEALVALSQIAPDDPEVFDCIVDALRASRLWGLDLPTLWTQDLEEHLAAGGAANLDRLALLLQERGLDKFAARVLWLMNDARATSLVNSSISSGSTWLSRQSVFFPDSRKMTTTPVEAAEPNPAAGQRDTTPRTPPRTRGRL